MGVPTRSPLLVGALVALAAVAAGDSLASPVPPQAKAAIRPAHDLARLREWVDAVDRHLPGQADNAAAGVGSWSRDELEVLFLDLKALFQLITTPDRPRFPRTARPLTSPELQELHDLAVREVQRVAGRPIKALPDVTSDDARRAVNRLVRRSALLHTDIALLVSAAADRVVESSARMQRPALLTPRSSVLVADGRQVGLSYYGTHWDFARLLLDETMPDPTRDVTVLQWYRAIAAFFASEHLLSESRVHLERAHRLFPADAEIVAASGRLYETYAAPRVQHFLETSQPMGDLTNAVGSTRSNLRQAENFFRRAVELDDRFAAARLHLGRVAALQGHHEDAATELERAANTAADPVTQYYAWLFLGVEEQALGRPDRARECFDKAAALYPLAQSPYLALSQLARRSGDRLSALRAIQHVLDLPADDHAREDPWWTYLDGSDAEARMLLTDLRAVLFLEPAGR